MNNMINSGLLKTSTSSSPLKPKLSPRGTVDPRFFAETMQLAPKIEFDINSLSAEDAAKELDLPVELISYIRSLEEEIETLKSQSDDVLETHVKNTVDTLERSRDDQIQEEIKQLKHNVFSIGKQNELTEDLLKSMTQNYDTTNTELQEATRLLKAYSTQASNASAEVSSEVTVERSKLVSQMSQLRAENTKLNSQLASANKQLSSISQKFRVDSDDIKRRSKMDTDKDRRKFDEIADVTRRQQMDLDEALSRATAAEKQLKDYRDDSVRATMELDIWKSRYDRLWKHCGELEVNLEDRANESSNIMQAMTTSMKESQLTSAIRNAQSTARIHKAFKGANQLSAVSSPAKTTAVGESTDDDKQERPKRTPPPKPAEAVVVNERSSVPAQNSEDVWDTPVVPKSSGQKFASRPSK